MYRNRNSIPHAKTQPPQILTNLDRFIENHIQQLRVSRITDIKHRLFESRYAFPDRLPQTYEGKWSSYSGAFFVACFSLSPSNIVSHFIAEKGYRDSDPVDEIITAWDKSRRISPADITMH